MRNLILPLLLILCTNAISQSFKYDANGLNPLYVVKDLDSVSQNDAYTRTIEWINRNYVSAEDVIQSKIDGKLIRFIGRQSNAITVKMMGVNYVYDLRYMIEINFKEDRFRIKVLDVEVYTPPSQYAIGGWASYLSNSYGIYKKNGDIRKRFVEFPKVFTGSLNNIEIGLYNYIQKGQTNSEEDDW